MIGWAHGRATRMGSQGELSDPIDRSFVRWRMRLRADLGHALARMVFCRRIAGQDVVKCCGPKCWPASVILPHIRTSPAHAAAGANGGGSCNGGGNADGSGGGDGGGDGASKGGPKDKIRRPPVRT